MAWASFFLLTFIMLLFWELVFWYYSDIIITLHTRQTKNIKQELLDSVGAHIPPTFRQWALNSRSQARLYVITPYTYPAVQSQNAVH